MKEKIIVKAERRSAQGSPAAGRVRREGKIPAVVYTGGKAAESIALNEHDFENMLRHHQSEHMIIDLVIDGDKARQVLVKDVQHHPLTGRFTHLDFHEVAMDRKLKVEVPIELVGDPVGVTTQGGMLDHLLRDLEIECLPGDLIEQITVDVSGLEIGKHLSVKDIQLDPAKFKILTPSNVAVAAVSVQRAEVAATTEEEAAAGEEPEVITEKEEKEAQ